MFIVFDSDGIKFGRETLLEKFSEELSNNLSVDPSSAFENAAGTDDG